MPYIPKDMIDYDLASRAVSKFGYLINYIPNNLKDTNLIYAAISRDGE